MSNNVINKNIKKVISQKVLQVLQSQQPTESLSRETNRGTELMILSRIHFTAGV